jgi:hypothetical protein
MTEYTVKVGEIRGKERRKKLKEGKRERKKKLKGREEREREKKLWGKKEKERQPDKNLWGNTDPHREQPNLHFFFIQSSLPPLEYKRNLDRLTPIY